MPEDKRTPPPDTLTPPEWLELLRIGEVMVLGQMPWSSNITLLCEIRNATKAGWAVYKPGRGERHLADFPPDLYRREIAAYELSVTTGLNVVPETVDRPDGPLGPGSFQRFVQADFTQHYFTLLDDLANHDGLAKIAGLDILANNADRKGGHVLLDQDHLIWGIDNGLSFHVQPKLRTVIWDFAGKELPRDVIAACQVVCSGVTGRLASLLSEDELDALSKRAKRALDEGTFPFPEQDRHSYPWPLL